MIAWEQYASGSDGNDNVRRLRVPGGWLYQVEHHAFVDPVEARPGHWIHGWHAPVFVPDVNPDQNPELPQ